MSNYTTKAVEQVGSALISQTQVHPGGGGGISVETLTPSSTEVYAVVIDNTLNAAISYLKVFNTTGAVTEGTTIPNFILKADASIKVQYTFDTGVTLSAGMKAMVTTTAVTAGVTAPSGNVTVHYLVTVT